MSYDSNETKPDICGQDDILRQQAVILRSRLNYLQGRDRIIMTMYVINGISHRQIALLLRTSPSNIFRLIKKITYTLTKGVFARCLENKEQFSSCDMSIAKDYFVNGLTIKHIAKKQKTSFYYIYEKLKEIQHTADII